MLFTHFIIPGLLTFALTKISIPFLMKSIAALPSERGLHYIKKPSGGGIIFALVYIIFLLNNDFYSLALLSFPIAIIGLFDDKFCIPFLFKLVVQALTVISTILYIYKYQDTFINNLLGENLFFICIFIFIGLCIINFINFMDGIDGLICGSFIIIFLTVNSEVIFLIPLVGSLLGFLTLNWQPSKIFMGDSGSLFIGSIFMSIIFISESDIEFTKLMLIATPLLLDPLITLIRRILDRQNFWKPHKLHLYQRLVSSGMSHAKVSSIYIFSITLLCIFYKFSGLFNLALISLTLVLIGIFLDFKTAKPFKENTNF